MKEPPVDLLDLYAAAALAGILARGCDFGAEEICTDAWMYAVQMLDQRRIKHMQTEKP